VHHSITTTLNKQDISSAAGRSGAEAVGHALTEQTLEPSGV